MNENQNSAGKFVTGLVYVCACAVVSWLVINVVTLSIENTALKARQEALGARVALAEERLTAAGRLADLPDGTIDTGTGATSPEGSGADLP